MAGDAVAPYETACWVVEARVGELREPSHNALPLARIILENSPGVRIRMKMRMRMRT